GAQGAKGGGAGGGTGGGTGGGAGGGAASGDPGSNIVPPGTIGNTGVDPEDPITFEDTGSYDPTTGFAEPFASSYNIMEGSAGGQVLGHDQNPEAKARLQDQADRRKQEWVAAGGNPAHFQAFNPTKGDFASIVPGWANMTAEQKWEARQEERMKFYNQQIAALRGAEKPGVQN
ncbi:MAG: hypothetical protein ACYSW8_32530, partial [Planctomycetota bacterium]